MDALWRSEAKPPEPGRIGQVDDRTRADVAFRRARSGEVLVYRGDYQNARQLLAAMGRRLDRFKKGSAPTLPETFAAERRKRRMEHEVLSRLAIPLEQDYRIPLARAPNVSDACREAWGEASGPSVVPLRDLLGVIGAHEWRRKGVFVAALQGNVHPHYGVFGPIRGEYVDRVDRSLRENPGAVRGRRAWDVGTGTGVLAILLARHGATVVATDNDPRAIACARENVERFGLTQQIEIVEADLFPPGKAELVICNPPWIPETPVTPMDRAVYDPGSGVLRRFLAGLPEHLAEGGEGWLVLSDLAERLGLRSQAFVEEAIAAAGLEVKSMEAIRPVHPRAKDTGDPLHEARVAEQTRLFRLAVR
jgi:methylase of polypeptide subunit release factors